MPPANQHKRYRKLCEALGMSQGGAGKFLGISERTARRWWNDEVDIDENVIILLELMVQKKVDPYTARQMAQMTQRGANYSDQRWKSNRDAA